MKEGQRGARSAFDDDRRRKGFPWWLLGLLALALIALLLLLRSCGDDDSADTERGSATTPSAQEGADGNGQAGIGGRLTAGSRSLLPTRRGQQLAQSVGEDAQGDRVQVQEVVKDEGFFVGTSREDRVYVEYGGDVGETESGSGSYTPAVGDEVNLSGPVRPSPEDPEQTLNLARDDAQQVREQGIYINAETVQAAG
jgi:hypothetical protein